MRCTVLHFSILCENHHHTENNDLFFCWCQVYDKAAAAFKSEEDVVVAKVDADAHKELGSRYG